MFHPPCTVQFESSSSARGETAVVADTRECVQGMSNTLHSQSHLPFHCMVSQGTLFTLCTQLVGATTRTTSHASCEWTHSNPLCVSRLFPRFLSPHQLKFMPCILDRTCKNTESVPWNISCLEYYVLRAHTYVSTCPRSNVLMPTSSHHRYATFKLAQEQQGGDKLTGFTRILHRTVPDYLMDEVRTYGVFTLAGQNCFSTVY